MTLRSADRHYRLSSLIAARAAREARRARPRGGLAVARVVASHQVAQAVTSQRAVAEMLAEQDIASEAEAFLVSTAFTTEAESFMRMYESAGAGGAARLVTSLVQDAGRAAESVAVTVRPNVGYARHLSPPSCSRCAVLAGRIYRYSQGFQRHPGCDCTMSAVADGDITQAVDPLEMLKAGQLTGLSKADARALADGADFGQVVNVRRLKAGLTESGRVLSRRGRPTPEAIYARTSSRDEAVAALAKAGYII